MLISRHVEPSDLNCLSSLGIDPMQKRYVMLKSRIHWRAGLGTMAKAVVECAGVGVCTSDYGQLKFNNVRRPIYPLDLPEPLMHFHDCGLSIRLWWPTMPRLRGAPSIASSFCRA